MNGISSLSGPELDALFLRRLDDTGKREELSGLGFGDFVTVTRSMMTSGAGT